MVTLVNYTCKSFIKLTPGLNAITIFHDFSWACEKSLGQASSAIFFFSFLLADSTKFEKIASSRRHAYEITPERACGFYEIRDVVKNRRFSSV